MLGFGIVVSVLFFGGDYLYSQGQEDSHRACKYLESENKYICCSPVTFCFGDECHTNFDDYNKICHYESNLTDLKISHKWEDIFENYDGLQ